MTPDHFNHHKTPLLGTANAWDPKAKDTWHHDLQDTVKEWQGFWGTRNKPRQHSGTHVSDGLQEIPLAHGSFDNDVGTMTRILNRTLGKNLKFPIENLRGYSPPDETHGSPTDKPRAWTEERQK